MFEEYKSNRDKTPEPILVAIPYIKKILEGMKISILEKEGFEADDIIGTVAKDAEENNFKVYMVTPDKDFAQLVSHNIFYVNLLEWVIVWKSGELTKLKINLRLNRLTK